MMQFNGGKSNYDGFGRAASDNNALYVFNGRSRLHRIDETSAAMWHLCSPSCATFSVAIAVIWG